jgi:mRNA-degrading endonuclease RelE of RelBE toxin-antitoxin system
MFTLLFTDSALEDLRYLKKGDRNTVLDAIQEQLTATPLTETRNRKPLRANELAT